MKSAKSFFLFLSINLITCPFFAQQSADPNLVAHYPLENNYDDLGKFKIPARPIGKVQPVGSIFGQKNTAVRLAGSGHLDLNKHQRDIRNTFTISLWVKYVKPPVGQDLTMLVSKYDPVKGVGFNLVIRKGQLALEVRDNFSDSAKKLHSSGASADVLQKEKRHQVTAICDGQNLQIWMDGKLTASGVFDIKYANFSNFSSLNLGNASFRSQKQLGFHGEVSQFRLFNRALSPSEIKNLIYEDLLNAELIHKGRIEELPVTYDEGISKIKKAAKINPGFVPSRPSGFSDLSEIYGVKILNSNAEFSIGNYQKSGNYFFLQRDYEKALIYFRKSLLINLKEDNPSAKKTANSFIAVGKAYQRLGDFRNAVWHYKEALDLLEAGDIQSPESWEMIQSVINFIGEAHTASGETDVALTFLKNGLIRARPDTNRFEIPDWPTLYHDQMSNYYVNLGNVFATENDPTKAREFYKKALQSAKLTRLETNIRISQAHLGLAQTEENKDNQANQIQKAIGALTTDFKPRSIYENPNSFEKFPRFHRQQALRCLSRKISFLKDYNFNTQSKKAALATCHKADELITLIRRDLGDSEGQKKRILKDFLDIYEKGTDIAYSLFNTTKQQKFLADAYFFTEKNKSVLLSEAVNAAKVWSYVELPDSIVQKEKNLKNRLVKVENEIRKSEQKEDWNGAEKLRENEFTEANLNYDLFRNELKRQYPKSFARQYEINVPKIEEIQKHLDDRTLIVEYAVSETGKNDSENRNRTLYIYTINNENLQLKKAVWEADLDKKISEFYHLLKKTTIVRKRNKTKFLELGHHIYKVLVKPIEAQLVGMERIIFVGEGSLNYLPFEVLLRHPNETDFQKMPYLMRDFEISNHYSISLLLESFQNDHGRYGGVLTFAPVFEDESKTYDADLTDRYVSDTTFSFFRSGKFVPLVWTKKEVGFIDSLFTNSDRLGNEQLFAARANEKNLKNHIEKPYKFIHIATHSFADLSRPDYSGIACFSETEGSDEDGILYVNEIYNLKIKADLVALSSCESGVGELLAGEGMLGLNRAFMYAGSPNVLYSLWKVNDKFTAEFMIDFYDNVLKGKSYSAALQRAKLNLLNQKESSLPVYWSAFQFIGR